MYSAELIPTLEMNSTNKFFDTAAINLSSKEIKNQKKLESKHLNASVNCLSNSAAFKRKFDLRGNETKKIF